MRVGGGPVLEDDRLKAVLADSADDFRTGIGVVLSETGGWIRALGRVSFISHCSFVFSGFGVSWESLDMVGRSSSSDSRNACMLIGTRARVGGVTAVEVDTLEIVRSKGELDVDGEFGSDSGNLGSWSRLAFDEVFSKCCLGS